MTGTAAYYGPNRYRLLAPLVKEDYRADYPTQFGPKLLKAFGNSN